jgi:hypothetical protein
MTMDNGDWTLIGRAMAIETTLLSFIQASSTDEATDSEDKNSKKNTNIGVALACVSRRYFRYSRNSYYTSKLAAFL